jgi:hypothetical protein
MKKPKFNYDDYKTWHVGCCRNNVISEAMDIHKEYDKYFKHKLSKDTLLDVIWDYTDCPDVLIKIIRSHLLDKS